MSRRIEEYDVVLLDVDHTPRHVLHPSHASFYTVEGLQQLRRHLRPVATQRRPRSGSNFPERTRTGAE